MKNKEDSLPKQFPSLMIVDGRSGMGEAAEAIAAKIQIQEMKKKGGLLKKVIMANEEFDRTSGAVPSICLRGCVTCCYDSFAISEIDFMLLLWYLKENYENRIEELRKIACLEYELHKLLHPEYIKEIESVHRATRPGVLMSKKKLPCILLSASGRCSVYEARPFACRVYGAVENCERVNKKASHITEGTIKLGSTHTVQFTNGFMEEMSCRAGVEYPIFYWFGRFLSEGKYESTMEQLGNYLKRK